MTSRTRMLLISSLTAVFLAFLVLAGCGGPAEQTSPQEQADQQTPEETETPSGTEEGGLYTPAYQPTGTEVAVMKTTKGDITIELYGKDAPIHVGNFIELAEKGFYDATKFHRFEPGFVVQGGDPQTKEASADQIKQAVESGNSVYGTGGPGYMIKGEYDPKVNPRKHEKGALGMARSMDPDSAGSQFYFALDALPSLDGNYTVFGKITKGLDVMEKLGVGDEVKSVEIIKSK